VRQALIGQFIDLTTQLRLVAAIRSAARELGGGGPLRAFVESCDVVAMIAAMLADGNTAGRSARLNPDKSAGIADILMQLSRRTTKRTQRW
jgi:hypothetical protein